MSYNDTLNITGNAENLLKSAITDEYFRDNDAEIIFRTLEEQMVLISFGDYLRRYIYRKARLEQPFETVELKVYRAIINDSFEDTRTPTSFAPTSVKPSAAVKNWLTQRSVSRDTVLLLGFGLYMSAEDVNMLLTKGLREYELNPKSPKEAVCWYCYKNCLRFSKYLELMEQYERSQPRDISSDSDDETQNICRTLYVVKNEQQLVEYLAGLKNRHNASHIGYTARKTFDKLYLKARELVAKIYNEFAKEDFDRDLEAYSDRLWNSDRLFYDEKRELINRKKSERRQIVADDITEGDIEKVICSAVPLDKHGNLIPSKRSSLNELFSGKRLSRQRMSTILSGKTEVDRFDLITLNFFIYSQMCDEIPEAEKRYSEFIDSTNQILEKCSMGKLYVQNPYESFVMMCVLSDDPLSTYSDVLEMSYQ